MGQQGSRILLASSVLFVVGVFVGFGSAELVATSPPVAARDEAPALTPTAAPRERDAGDAELAAALGELRLTLDALRRVLEEPRPVANTPGRTPVAAAETSETSRDLAASMDALAAALRAIPRAGATGTVGGGLVVPGWVDRRQAFDTDGLMQLYRTDDGGERAEAAARAWRSDHLFLTRQDILDRYGKPDDVYQDDGFVEWCYVVRGTKEEQDIDFSFHDGVVVNVDYSYDWEE